MFRNKVAWDHSTVLVTTCIFVALSIKLQLGTYIKRGINNGNDPNPFLQTCYQYFKNGRSPCHSTDLVFRTGMSWRITVIPSVRNSIFFAAAWNYLSDCELILC